MQLVDAATNSSFVLGGLCPLCSWAGGAIFKKGGWIAVDLECSRFPAGGALVLEIRQP
jgi:hypothetical protein